MDFHMFSPDYNCFREYLKEYTIENLQHLAKVYETIVDMMCSLVVRGSYKKKCMEWFYHLM